MSDQPQFFLQYLHDGWECQPAEARQNDDHLQYARSGQLNGTYNGSVPASFPAEVPGTIHTDLLRNGIIEDPFFGDHETRLQWIGEWDWIYRISFQPDPEIWKRRYVVLLFEGLDTYADVYLNGEQIISADNMFRQWQADVRDLLVENENILEICFNNVFKVNKPKWDQAPLRLQAVDNNDQAEIKLSVYSRKAGFHFGWDWGPRLITCGVWRPVCLQAWDDIRLISVRYEQSFPEQVIEEGGVTSYPHVDMTADVLISAHYAQDVRIVIRDREQVYLTRLLTLHAGQHRYPLTFRINQPKLWWCNGLGKPYLYHFEVLVEPVGGEPGGEPKNFVYERTEVGIRKIDLVRELDDFGKSFYIRINDIPVFVKGANYIPQDNFQTRVDIERYEHVIRSAAAVNMNMLRVWGGGIYEEDEFYRQCDRHGIMVWQDIMFACGMFPADDAFLENVRNEVRDNVERLRNHACLVLWCGNNENEMIWHLEWKDQYDSEQQRTYEQDLHKLFYDVIPEAIHTSDGTRDYIPGSPLAGYNDMPVENGNLHYWEVWHGRQPFEEYGKQVGRFMTEYGFQSFPDPVSVNKFTGPGDNHAESYAMEVHQRCKADKRRDGQYGNRLITDYMARYYREPKDFESFLLVSQLLQAKGVGMAVETHRLRKQGRYCMGTLYWQLNDCWPAVSWSGMDYYGRWKALHYHLRQLYGDLLLVAEIDDHEKTDPQNPSFPQVRIFVVSDLPESLSGTRMELEINDFTGKQIMNGSAPCDVAPFGVSQTTFSLNKPTENGHPSGCYIRAELKQGDRTKAIRLFYFVEEKNMELPDPGLAFELEHSEETGGYKIILQTRYLAKDVVLILEGTDHSFSDNYFDMEPKETRVVGLSTRSSLTYVQNHLKVHSLAGLS